MKIFKTKWVRLNTSKWLEPADLVALFGPFHDRANALVVRVVDGYDGHSNLVEVLPLPNRFQSIAIYIFKLAIKLRRKFKKAKSW